MITKKREVCLESRINGMDWCSQPQPRSLHISLASFCQGRQPRDKFWLSVYGPRNDLCHVQTWLKASWGIFLTFFYLSLLGLKGIQ